MNIIIKLLGYAGRKALGIFWLVTSIFFATSLFSFNQNDASLNHITNSKVTNWAGSLGAYVADPIMQAFGYSFSILLVMGIADGLRMIRNQKTNYILLRFTAIVMLIPVVAMNFAMFDTAKHVVSHGGYLGSFFLQEALPIIEKRLLLIASTLTTIATYTIAIGISFSQWFYISIATFKGIKHAIAFLLWLLHNLHTLVKRAIPRNHIENETINENPSSAMPAPIIEIGKRVRGDYKKPPIQPSLQLPLNEFPLPPTTLLNDAPIISRKNFISEDALNQNSKLLQQVLQDFGVFGKVVRIHPGPVVTLYEFEPSAGTKSSRVIGLADDISRSMSAISARIAVLPGKNALGIELPNIHRETVYLRELMETSAYIKCDSQLPLVLGKNIGGDPIIADLAKMPHLLVAGTTGSGKSVAINTMILSLLYKYSPKQCQLIMIDPKMLELTVYEGIPHLLAPVVTEAKKAVTALKWVVKEMENRYRSMSALGVRNIQGYNKALEDARRQGTKLMKEIQTGFDRETGRPIFESIEMPNETLPYIVVIVDEMADLMITAGKEIESSIQRLAQMARAAGIHIIMATQRPSVDVITGVIKANFPTRISFQVTSKIDSRTILGEQGAEQLLGMGDMLHMAGGSRIERVHGPFVSDKEVEEVVSFLKKNGEPLYKQDITIDDTEQEDSMIESTGDDLYDQAVQIILTERRPTTSYIQRCLRIGYNKAATLIEQMEKNGVVSAPNSLGKRTVLIGEDE